MDTNELSKVKANHLSLTMEGAYSEYWRIGKRAVREGILTSKDLWVIARLYHRKEPYWKRHLRDLIDIITTRINAPKKT